MISTISKLIIPLMVLLVILYGFYKKVDVYDTFIDGVKESFDAILKMFPCMLGMILGVNIFLNSGVLDYVFNLLRPVLSFPVEILPMAFLRSISGNTSLAVLNNIFETYGVDSFIANLGSIIQGSSDTTLYVLTLYFGSVGIKKIKYSLYAGLIADMAGIIASIVLAGLFFGT